MCCGKERGREDGQAKLWAASQKNHRIKFHRDKCKVLYEENKIQMQRYTELLVIEVVKVSLEQQLIAELLLYELAV